MLSPLIPDYSGAIDPRKVRFALLRYRLVFLRVIMVNFLTNTALVFMVFHDMFISLLVVVSYLCVGLCAVIAVDLEKRTVPIGASPECAQPDTPIYNEIVALWTACCKRSGYRSGSVYVVYPLPDTEFGRIHSFGVLRTLLPSCTPILFITARMFSKLSRKELLAAVFHESGHLQAMSMIPWCAANIIALPISMTLRIVAQVRMIFPLRWKIPVCILYGFERCLHYVSIFAVHHADEYSADACAAESQDTAEHLIMVLLRLDDYAHVRCVEDVAIVEASFALDRESHQHTHPTTEERIRRLERLRKDRS
jgi:hypothetical protein